MGDVYLLIGRADDDAGQALLQMEPLAGDGHWGLTLNLKPGAYRYRYYAVHGDLTAYVPPAWVGDGPVAMHGLDAILHAGGPSTADAPAVAAGRRGPARLAAHWA